MFQWDDAALLKMSGRDLSQILVRVPFDQLRLAVLVLNKSSQEKILKVLTRSVAEEIRATIDLKEEIFKWKLIQPADIQQATIAVSEIMAHAFTLLKPTDLVEDYSLSFDDLRNLPDQDLKNVLSRLSEEQILFAFLEEGEIFCERVSRLLSEDLGRKMLACTRLKRWLYESGVVSPIQVFEYQAAITHVVRELGLE